MEELGTWMRILQNQMPKKEAVTTLSSGLGFEKNETEMKVYLVVVEP